MHFSCFVVVGPEVTTIAEAHEAVSKAMDPYYEGNEAVQVTDEDGHTYWTNPQGWWDWWQIGGRWSGALDPDYDPMKDPRNQTNKPCHWCKGTGAKNAEVVFEANNDTDVCSQCSGTGKEAEWPTQWAEHAGNIQPVTTVLERIEAGTVHTPYRLVAPDAPVRSREKWDDEAPSTWKEGGKGAFVEDCGEEEMKVLLSGYLGANVEIVDYHS
jgi:hypothetical protein